MVRLCVSAVWWCVVAAVTTQTLGQSCPEDFTLVGDRCVHVYTDTYDGLGPALLWSDARDKCRGRSGDGWTMDLAIMDLQSLQDFNAHIAQAHSGMVGYIFWVGAEKVDGAWQWIDGSPIDDNSYMWLCSSPYESGGAYGMLVPGYHSSLALRFYMTQYEADSVGPSFVCVAQPDSTTE